MEVLEAIRKRRTVRVPFMGKSVPDDVMGVFAEISTISPSGDPVSWRIQRVDDKAKPELARIVKEEFGEYFQKDSRRFRQVFSEYPKWLRFSEARDGIRLVGFPNAARHFYRIALGRRFGPIFGKLGVMNAEIRSYCRNIVDSSAVFGVFLDRRAGSASISPIINAGAMLQNLRLAATALGLGYQDLGWITATKTASERARELVGAPGDHAAINFFRIGHAEASSRSDKQSNFRRELKDIVHVERFGNKGFQGSHPVKTGVDVLDAIRGRGEKNDSQHLSKEELLYMLEAARWAPTGFNVQPFEFIVTESEGAAAIIVLESRERRDPDPGPCETLARGGVLQNIRLASRALGLVHRIKKPRSEEEGVFRSSHRIPDDYSLVAEVGISRRIV